MKFTVPRGTRDILYPEIVLWQQIEDRARRIFSVYNYREVRTPIFEETELFERSMGESSDVVQKQMLNLASQKVDVDGKPLLSGLSLRPEGTAAVVRSYIQNNLHKKERISKFFYIGPMFRGERPQKGRLRQFHQIGVEVIGANTASPYLDAEVIALSVELLKSFGLKRFKLKINTLGSSSDKDKFSGILRSLLEPKISLLCDDCQQRFDRNVFRVLDCKNKRCRDIVNSLDINYSYLSEESIQYYEQVKAILRDLGIEFEESMSLVRGLDYYTHIVFEIAFDSLGSQDALGAGGRYNNLVHELGGPQVDAVGFALGIERILLAGHYDENTISSHIDCFIISMESVGLRQAFILLNKLRSNGICCDLGYIGGSIKSQMRMANRAGARFVIIFGEEEIKNNEITVKDMNDGSQKRISLSNVLQYLKEKL